MQYQYTADPNVVFPHNLSQEDNPFGKFTQNTYSIQKNSQIHNFGNAFKRNEPMIERQNFANQNNFLHNNVHQNLLSEYLVDYDVDIDSKDRDIATYQDPFKYIVSFAPVPKGTDTHNEWIDPHNHSLGQHTVKTVYTGASPPYIRNSFKNIKYIRVDSVQLPRYYGITYDSGSGTWIMDTSKDLSKDRYVVIKFKNVDSIYNLSTNSVVESSGIKLIPDTIPLSSNFYYAVPANANNIFKIYNMASLGNLDKLYVEFYNSSGQLLKYTGLDPTQDTTDVRNPSNVNLQNNMTLIFGVVENEMNTEVKFSQ